jgi:Zn finger protein HypA/HybF involved in hydrogenase expression
MHEASVTRDIVRYIEEVSTKHNGQTVLGVKVILGPLAGFSASSLREHLAHDALGTVAEGAHIGVKVAGEEDRLGPLTGANAAGVLLESIEFGPSQTWEA